jgi:predicted short-subunit dehydrogenase-like oxidoreductase (DUF2520 family)
MPTARSTSSAPSSNWQLSVNWQLSAADRSRQLPVTACRSRFRAGYPGPTTGTRSGLDRTGLHFVTSVRIIGPGRAGSALARALAGAGWDVAPLLGRHDELRDAASGTDLLVLAVPDGAIGEVASAVEPVPSTVVAHLAGSVGLDVLAPHPRRAAVHPLVPLPGDAALAATRLQGATFAVAGDFLGTSLVASLGGTAIEVADHHRVRYHAAACIASNHLVALLGQVERIAAEAGVPLDAYLDLVRATVDNVAELGPAAALTGPVARGDEATVARHLAALPEQERAAYEAMADQARRLARRPEAAAR